MKMTPVLFGSDATTYTTQGLGSLKDAVTCKVSEEINGPYELEMTYPVTGRRYASLQNRCIIYCKPGPDRTPQPFRIYRITKPLNGIITVYARHISYDLAGIPVDPYTANSALTAMQGLQSHAAVVCPFAFSTTLTDNANFAVKVPTGIRKVLGDGNASILGVFGGELEWDGFTVYLRSRRGQDTGVRIAYGKNLTNIEQDENIASLVTGVIGYWTNSDGVVVQGPVVNAPGNYSYNNIDTVDFSSDFKGQPTPEQLAQRTQEYITAENVGVPEVSISVSWLQLEQYAGYEDTATRERVSLGDTVTVSFPQLSVDATARVVKTVYDVLLDQYETCDVGSVKPNIAATIAGQQQEITALPSTSTVEQIVDTIAQTIMGVKGGAVRLLDTNGDGYPDTLYIADNPDPNAAVKVWRFNYEGWGASSNGYNGPFEMSAALGIGMYGQFITAGIINAALIKAGVLQSKDGTTFYLDLDNGILRMNASEFTVSGQTVQQIADASSSAAAQQVAQQAQENLENYAETVTADLTSLQSQIDGQIMTFFYDYLPTSDNVPASEWTTDAEKQQHLGDLFYVVDNAEYGGQAYRWAQVNGAYQWIIIEDTAVAQALEQSAQALDTADSKRRVFVAQPVPPYDVGDLWSQGPSGSLMVCCNARSSGSYLSSDWQSSADYINSQQASTIADAAVEAQTQTDIFNKLTNDGQLQGLYMRNGQLYINASYMNTGTLSAVRIQSKDGSSYWDLTGGNAVFNNNSIQINSENFRLDGSGNVAITGSFFAHSDINKVSVQNGSISLSRLNSSVNAFRDTVSVYSAGTTGPIGVVDVKGPSSSGNAVLNVQLSGGYSGGALFICNASGQVKLTASIDGSGNSYINMGGTGKITTQTLEVGYIKANGQTYKCGWIYNTTVGYNMLCAI